MSYKLKASTHFNFSVEHEGKEIEYQFWYPTAEAVEDFEKLEDDKKTEKMLSFVKVNKAGDPEFADIFKKLNFQIIKQFNDMVSKEFGQQDS